MKKTYWICRTDGYGQRTGDYYKVELSADQIEIDRHGDKLYNGKFLYDDKGMCKRAAHD